VGESEANLAKAFAMAMASAKPVPPSKELNPVIMFFDELDSIGKFNVLYICIYPGWDVMPCREDLCCCSC
jgi:hypothetical protein